MTAPAAPGRLAGPVPWSCAMTLVRLLALIAGVLTAGLAGVGVMVRRRQRLQ